ncbi:hypothetical protein VO63_30550 [Streptomyces showdoensis]|uniref:Uncharacterized protein n=1 Tax=Streptomyces showdoensis TaxID=68268 RepID=A0A2P2GGZ9_STREW|nr:hypothetical protein VO63_30550 [Streptomyces showdoensis]
MFNRIRRAVRRTRERHAAKGRHSRPLPPTRPTPTADLLAGEETALVRPYVLTAEERASRRWNTARRLAPSEAF